MDFGVCSGTEMSDENPRKRQIECHIKYDPKDKGKDIIYPFYFILLGIFSCIYRSIEIDKEKSCDLTFYQLLSITIDYYRLLSI